MFPSFAVSNSEKLLSEYTMPAGYSEVSQNIAYALIEKNKAAYAKLCSMREKLKAETLLDIHCGDCFTLLPSFGKKFDIIFIDPPFAFNLHEKAIKLSFFLPSPKADRVFSKTQSAQFSELPSGCV